MYRVKYIKSNCNYGKNARKKMSILHADTVSVVVLYLYRVGMNTDQTQV